VNCTESQAVIQSTKNNFPMAMSLLTAEGGAIYNAFTLKQFF